MKKVSEIIRRLRMERGWSQKELAKRVNKSQNTISQIENGMVVSNAEDLMIFAKVFGVPVGYLFGESTEKEEIIEVKIEEKKEEEKKEEDALRFTTKLLKELIKEGIIKDKDDIKEKFLSQIAAMIELDYDNLKKSVEKEDK